MIGLAKSLGDFIVKALQSVGTNAWIPAIAIVLGLAFPLQVRADEHHSPMNAISALTHVGVDGLAVGFLFVVLAALFVQPFQYAFIQLLEGYWGNSDKIAKVYKWRAEKFAGRMAEINRKLYAEGEKAAHPDDAARIAAFFAEAPGGNKPSTPTGDAQNEPVASPTKPTENLSAIRLKMALKRLPSDGEMMPTRLGNALRAAELSSTFPRDGAERPSIQHQMLDDLDQIPEQLRAQHDLHRSRLDLFCTMVWVWTVITVWTAVTLATSGSVIALAIVPAIAVPVSYSAALLAADGYGDVLMAIGRTLRSRTSNP